MLEKTSAEIFHYNGQTGTTIGTEFTTRKYGFCVIYFASTKKLTWKAL